MQIHSLKNKNTYSKKETISFFVKFIGKSFLYALLVFCVSLLSLVFIIIGDTAYNFHKGNNVVPLFGGYIIITKSMVPTINVNDAVIVKRADEVLNIGDIITFSSSDPRYEGLIITHRVVGAQSLTSGDLVYRTKGDNNNVEDASVVLPEKIYGKVIFKIPRFGYLKSFLNKPLGFTIFIVLPILLIFYINIVNVKRMRNEKV